MSVTHASQTLVVLHQCTKVQCQTYGYLPSRKASPPIGWYQIILLHDRGTRVNNLPRVAFDSGAAQNSGKKKHKIHIELIAQ